MQTVRRYRSATRALLLLLVGAFSTLATGCHFHGWHHHHCGSYVVVRHPCR
jgi:hypothetical protein